MGGGAGGAANGEAAAVDAAAPAVHDTTPKPALQVIVLGSGGGPLESNVTAFLVRSLASGWSKGSVVAVDAGVHLSAIKGILEQTQPANLGEENGPQLPYTLETGPFAGLQVSNATADANAAHIHKSLIETYLITHPHLDHIAGFVINTAGLPGSRPKRVAGLPSTITALKTHVFNNVIWPNLSDENNGAGLVTYMRLVEGGSPALGEGEGKGYLEICNGLAVKIWSVSHGHCIERHSHRGSGSTRHGSFDASAGPPLSMPSPSRNLAQHTSLPTNIGAILQQHERLQASPGGRRGSSFSGGGLAIDESICVYDSSAYFIRDVTTGREILMFGDVEPDSVSLSPRNRQVWQEAAPKIAAGNLAAIFIECSYDDSRCVERLFGHLTPRYICEEMTALAEEVVTTRQEKEKSAAGSSSDKKRKRVSENEGGSLAKRKSTPQLVASRDHRPDHPLSPKSLYPRRRVSSAASSISDHGHHTHDDLPKSLPLPTHPLRSAISQEDPEEDVSLGSPRIQVAIPDADLDISSYASDVSPTTTPLSTTLPFPMPTSHPQQHPPQYSQQHPPQHHRKYSQQLHQHHQQQQYQHQLAQQHHQNPQQQTQHQHPQQQQEHKPPPPSLANVLKGLKVVIIHVKESMSDGVKAADTILEELEEHESEARLGVEYVVSEAGQDFYF
ncbi:hypothetical protein VTI74DRAFT_2903 [Chaetomium olivicolor]